MMFDRVPVDAAEGALLAYSVKAQGRRWKKGHRLTAEDVAHLREAGVATLTVARLEPGDITENAAAAALAETLACDGVRIGEASTGRCNLYATVAGIVRIKAAAIEAVNQVDEAITVATLPDFERVAVGAMLATIKIIPYAVRRASLDAAMNLARALVPVVEVAPFRSTRVGLISTTLTETKASLHVKNRTVLERRLAPTRATILDERIVAHEADAVSAAIRQSIGTGADLVLIYSAAAISDRADIVPSGLVGADGVIERLGMPVDPGNLILIGKVGRVPVIGIPGCARSSKRNGFDLVLERLLAGIRVTSGNIAHMGVGGLLKQPASHKQPAIATRVAAIVLAAGQSQRMGSTKQLADLSGKPMVRRIVEQVCASQADEVIVVTGHDAEAVDASLVGLPVRTVWNDDYRSGLSSSLRAGLVAVHSGMDGVLVVLGDMPGVHADALDALIAAFEFPGGHSIIAASHNGRRGNPVILGAMHFDEMSQLSGDVGAKPLLERYPEAVRLVEIGDKALVDIDTPSDLQTYVSGSQEPAN